MEQPIESNLLITRSRTDWFDGMSE